MKDVAQTKTISLLLPDYKLSWDHPVTTEVLLLLDTSFNPMLFPGDFSWLKGVGRLEVLKGYGKSFERVFSLPAFEVSL